jgi:hypothetical protein
MKVEKMRGHEKGQTKNQIEANRMVGPQLRRSTAPITEKSPRNDTGNLNTVTSLAAC